MIDDAELLRIYAEDRFATVFAEFVERRIGFVYATALRQIPGNVHMAQDVTQAVFVLAEKRAGELARHECLVGWLFITARNMARQLARDERRRVAREQEAARMNELQRDGNSADQERIRVLLNDTLEALRRDERDAVLLRFFEGRGFADIGVKLNLSEDAARMRVTRAVEKMRGVFAKHGVTSSAAALGALMTSEAAQGAPAGLAASVSASATASAGAVSAATAASVGANASASVGANAFFVFMSSAKITTVAIVALLLAAGGAYYGVQSERASSAALRQAHEENVRLTTQLRELEKQNATAAVGASSASAVKHDPEAATQVFLADHPEVKEKMAAWTNAIGARVVFRIAHEMNLSPAQKTRLAEINNLATRFGNSVPGYGDVMLTFGNRSSSSKRKQEMRDLLGEEGYEKFTELRVLDNVGDHFNIIGLSNALCFTDEPLTFGQARNLEKIAGDLEENHGDITDPQVRWNALVEQAGSILSPEQMRALVATGDRYVWKQTSRKWAENYDEIRTVITATRPSE
jgi:RNA polymerase sigma factor (sigma-70 family)